MYVGSVAYADNVTSLSPTLHGMQKMLDVGSLSAEEKGLIFNSKKSVSTMFVWNSRLPVVNPKLTVSGSFLPFKNIVSHLGVIMDFVRQCKISVEARLRKCFCRVDNVPGKIRGMYGSLKVWMDIVDQQLFPIVSNWCHLTLCGIWREQM